MKVGVYIYT